MTAPKKLRGSVAAFTEWIKTHCHLRTRRVMRKLKRRLIGCWNYYGEKGNGPNLSKIWWHVCRLLYKWSNRRSHRRSYKWKGLIACLKAFAIPGPRLSKRCREDRLGALSGAPG
jgi:hypothetical protein